MSLQQIVQEYQPSATAISVVKKSKISLLVGITGAGKDTIKHALLARSGFGDIISHTTRAPRSNEGVMEQDGVDYHFIDEDTAKTMLKNGEFLEAKMVHGTLYGTTVRAIAAASQEGIAITDVDVQGVAEYKKASEDVVAIFILPPSYDQWLTRLKRRYENDHEFHTEWPRRRDSAIKELETALSLPYYHCIINDTLSDAVELAATLSIQGNQFTQQDDEARLAARELLQQIKM